MLKQLYYQFIVEAHNETGKLIYMLRFRRNAGGKGKENFNTAPYVAALSLLKLAGLFFLRFAYVFVFMFLPCVLFASIRSEAGFQFRQSMVYFTVILSCFGGSLINPGMFDMDDDTYVLLTTMQMEPNVFFQGRILYKLFLDAVCFLLSYAIVGMDFPHAFYLVVWLLISRVVGETVNLYVFRYTDKIINEIPGFPAAIMAICILGAYGFPLLRGHVVDLTVIVYDYVWLLAALAVAAIIGYRLFTFDSYSYVARRFISRMEQRTGKNLREQQEEMAFLSGESNTDGDFKIYDRDEAKGAKYLHKVFLARNKEYIRNGLFVRCMILAVITAAAMIVCRMSGDNVRETIWTVLCGSLPVMVFIMYCMSVAPHVCKAMFYHIDCSMLRGGYSAGGRGNFRDYLIRLKIIGEMDILLALVLCIAFGLVGTAAGHGNDLSELFWVYVGILILSMFFSLYNLTVYYMCQPYNEEIKARNYTYFAANAGILCIAYGCIFINADAVVFDMAAGIILSAALSVSSALIYYLSDRTFKVYKA